MGFDIDCVINIQSYPGEYFCPVCRTLVYPAEAFQAQCTHVYCRHCLVHITNGGKACPYDGYLVTESDSKPLMESDKAFAEKIGKVRVHCLYFRSGCTWEGTFSDWASHGSRCSFGNSPVICNRCDIQILHRQVHDHTLICPAVVAASGLTKSGTTSSTVTAVVNQSVAQSGTPVSKVSETPAQNLNLQVNSIPHTPVAVSVPEQWYQQQYYQHYVGYDPYQQYYAIQQQVRQPQQNMQLQTQPQPQPVQQPNPVHQASAHPQVQQQAQGQVQTQPQLQPQPLPQGQSQVQLPPQGGQAQAHVPARALAPNYEVNLQQLSHPAMMPQTQIPPQVLLPPPHSQSTQPPQHLRSIGMRPPAQQTQVPGYQKPPLQMHHSPASQTHVQPQMHLQTEPYSQTSYQSNVQSQPNSQLYQSRFQPTIFHPQASQSAAPALLLRGPHPPLPPLSGQQALQGQTTQSGAPQQPLEHPCLASGSLHPVQVQTQVPHQRPLMRPPQSHGSISRQQPITHLPLQSQVPGVPNVPNQQPTYPNQHRPLMQPAQQVLPLNYPSQQQFPYPSQAQVHQQGLHAQQSMQSQMQVHPSDSPQLLSSDGFGPLAPTGPAQLDSAETSANQNYAKPIVLLQNATFRKTRSPPKGLAEEGLGGVSIKEEVRRGQNETAPKDVDNAANCGLLKSVVRQETADMKGALEESSGGKSSEAGSAEDQFHKEEFHTLKDSVSMKQVDLKNQIKLSKTAFAGLSPAIYGRCSLSAVPFPVPSTDGHVLPQQSCGSHHERSQSQVEGKPSLVGREGPAALPHHQQPLNRIEGKVPGNSGSPPKTFKSESGPQGSELCGIIGRAPSRHTEGHYGAQHAIGPNDVSMPREQVLGSGGRGPLMKPHDDEPHFLREKGRTAPDSMFGSINAKLKPVDQLNFSTGEPTCSYEEASSSRDKPFHWPYDAGPKLDPGALGSHSRFLPHPEHNHENVFGPGPHINPFSHKSPAGNYLGSSPRRFSEPSSFTHVTLALDDFCTREAHMIREGSRSLSESVKADIQDFLPFTDYAIRNDYPCSGFPNAENFSGGLGSHSFNRSRKRKPMSMAWCRLCEFDCETIDGLEMHSQTKEHQKITLDIVKIIKLQNKEKPEDSAGPPAASAGPPVHEGGEQA